MPSTMPVPMSAFNRISRRLTEVQPKVGPDAGFRHTGFLTPTEVVCPIAHLGRDTRTWAIEAPARLLSGFLGAATLVVGSVSPFDVMLEVQMPGHTYEDDASWPFDETQVRAILSAQQPKPEDRDSWEEYEEPLWDPSRSEVHSLVKDYFEQPDADSEQA